MLIKKQDAFLKLFKFLSHHLLNFLTWTFALLLVLDKDPDLIERKSEKLRLLYEMEPVQNTFRIDPVAAARPLRPIQQTGPFIKPKGLYTQAASSSYFTDPQR